MEPHALTVNGAPEPAAPSLVALLARKEIDAAGRGIAIALNGRVVPRRDWPTTILAPGDVVEIVRARSGG
jgi:sulfur carrier protein